MQQVKQTDNFENLSFLNRRSFLKAIPIGLMSGKSFSLSFPSLTAAITKKNSSQWDYKNPEQWGDISQEYQVCKTGTQGKSILKQPKLLLNKHCPIQPFCVLLSFLLEQKFPVQVN
ncbi:MAG: hypothetical protein Tsb0014_31590 [Pleurocapsa sp.]